MEHHMHQERDMDMDMGAMPMYYMWNTTTYILFSWWETTSVGWYIGSLLILFLLGVFYEFLNFSKIFLSAYDRKTNSSRSGPVQENLVYLRQSLLYTFTFIIAYQIMLAIMSFNIGVSLAIFAGIFVGNLVFIRFRPSDAKGEDVEVNSSGCH